MHVLICTTSNRYICLANIQKSPFIIYGGEAKESVKYDSKS